MELDARQFSSDKILRHIDRINAWIEDKNPSPITVELDLTNLCNHRCPECSGWYFQNRDQSYLPFVLLKDIIRQLAKAGVRGLIFTGGGEPLCHPQVNEAVKLAHGLGLDIGFITNGSLINKENSKVLLNCCTWLRVSLDAASREAFRKIHGLDGDAFQNVINNIRLLVETKKILNSRATIGVGYLTSDYTKDEMLKATELCKKLSVDYLQFRPMQIHDSGKFKYHRSDITKYIHKCMDESGNGFRVLCSKHKYDMMRDEEYGRHYKICYGHQFAAVIAADAKMYLCCHMRGYERYCIGDLKKNTFKEIWSSKQRKK